MKNSISIGIISLLFGVFILLLFIKIFDISYPITVTTQTKTQFSVVGEGKVDVSPDTAYITIGITQVSLPTAEEVKNQISDTNNKIIDAVTKLGIDKKDITTSNYSINPSYNYFPNGNNSISGYNGNATVTIKVTDIQKVSRIIDATTAVGANTVQNTRFEVSNPDKFREEARNQAIQNAKDQAQKLSQNLGIKLGKVINISESQPSGGPLPMVYAPAAMSLEKGNASPQIEPGTQTISSTVTLYYDTN